MDKKKPKIFVHPFTGGSSKTLSDNDFLELCKQINKNGHIALCCIVTIMIMLNVEH